MMTSAIISLVISQIFLSLSFLGQGAFLNPGLNRPGAGGQVLGASERGQENSAADNGGGFNQAVIKAVNQAKALPWPRLIHPPRLDEPMRRLPLNQESQGGKKRIIMTADDFPAENGVILDCRDNSLSFAKRSDRPWPIASITKLFTAYVFLDYNPGWETVYEIRPADKREGGKIYLFTGDKVTVKDLFYFSLVGSDNTATAALVAATGLSEAAFVEKINLKIKELGLKHTRIVDPAGLADGNISTAREVAEFAKIALAKEEISRASLTRSYEFHTRQGRKKVIASTNQLLGSFPRDDISLLGGKTGFVNSAGYCLVGRFKNSQGREIVTVVLGADSDSGRFGLTKKLVDLYYQDKP